MKHIYAELCKCLHENWVIENDVHGAISALKEYRACQYDWVTQEYAKRALKLVQIAIGSHYSALFVMNKYDIVPPYDTDAVREALDKLYEIAFDAVYNT